MRRWYRVLVSPDRLTDAIGRRCRVLRDDVDRIFWVDPTLTSDQQNHAVYLAVLSAWAPDPQP
ncbi:MAG TPA: hypothetical protein VGE74_17865, partial [Gemmata sp.]